MRVAYKIAIVVLLLLVVFLILFSYTGQIVRLIPLTLGLSNKINTGPIALSSILGQSTVLNYNNSLNPLFYSLLSYATTNGTNLNVSLQVYEKNPFGRIYLLNTTGFCVSCFSGKAFQNSLFLDLQKYNLVRNASSFGLINVSQLYLVKPNSIIVVPSGLLPHALLNGTGAGIFALLNQGDTIIYVGQDFSKSVGSTGFLFINSQSTISALAVNNLATQQFLPQRSVNLSADQQSIMPIPSTLSFARPTFSLIQGSFYQNVSYVNSGNGTVVAFENYPTSSWVSANSMASDVAKVINARLGIQKLAGSSVRVNLLAKRNGTAGIFAYIPNLLFNRTFNLQLNQIINRSYSLLSVTANNSKNNVTQETAVPNHYASKGFLNMPTMTGETEPTQIIFQANSSSRTLLLHLNIYDSNLSYVDAIPVGFVPTSTTLVKYYPFYLPSGNYIIELLDFNATQYAGALFNVASANITPTLLNFKNGTFAFSVYSDGYPVANTTYTININGDYNQTGRITNGTINYMLPRGTVINYGPEQFNFYFSNSKYSVSQNYSPIGPPSIPPIYIEFLIVIAVVVLLNLVLKPPNRDEYYIDVPEFPPAKKERVLVQSGDVLGVFDKVNYYHRWKYMPLNSDEIKRGISDNIRINSMPISVTVQNTNVLLSELAKNGEVVMMSGYYAPASWIEASKHSVDYLIVFRKLRDYCVSHAMLFTDLDSNANADMIVTKDSKQISIFIYTKSSAMRKLTLSREAKIALVFLNDETMREFMDELYDSVGKEAEILKMGVEYSYVKLLDSDHLDQLSF